MWGCELKRICNKTVQWKICHPPCEDVSWKDYLSEIVRYEMGHPPCEDVSWKIVAGLFATLYVQSSSMWGCELKKHSKEWTICRTKSSSLWGCELKNRNADTYDRVGGHPPCEDVSWKLLSCFFFSSNTRHPPCEDVSWKTEWAFRSITFTSSSLWGCELKRKATG